MSRRLAARTVVAMLAAVVLGACGIGRNAALRRGDPAATPGGTLSVGIGRPASIDPANAVDDAGQLVVKTMCDSLLEIDPVSGEVVGGLARSFSVDSASAVTVTLARGLRFNDGSSVSVEDAIASLSRVVAEAAPGVAEQLGSIGGYPFVHGDIATKDADDPAADRLTGVRRVSNDAFQITLAAPDPEFVKRLTLPLAAVVPKDLAGMRAADFARRPVCAGPYRLAEPWEPSAEVIKLVRSPKPTPVSRAYTEGGRGYADVIDFRVLPDRAAQVKAYGEGRVDTAEVPPSLLGEARDRGQSFVTAPTPFVEYVGFSFAQNSPVADRDVRRALAGALDRRALVETVYGGGRIPADGLLPPTVPDRAQGCAFDPPPPAAVASLRGTRLSLYVNDDPGERRLMEAVADQWRAVLGVDAQVVAIPWEGYLTRARSGEGFDGVFRTSAELPFPSAQAYLHPLLASAGIGQDNYGRYSSKAIDTLFDRRLTDETSLDNRAAVTRRIEAIACSEVVLVPISYGQVEYLVRTDQLASATGHLTDATTGRLVLREMFRRNP